MASSKVLTVTEGVFGRMTDFVLFLIAYQFELLGAKPNMRGVEKATGEAMKFISEVNYKSIKRAVSELRRKGLVRTAKTALMEAKITAMGKEKLARLLPGYQKKRPWDGNIYLVTYDIPVTHNRERATLRRFLGKIGCALLQESLWVTPYNPTQIVREFVEEKGLQGTVLVSLLGKDGSVGGMSMQELVEEVYDLSELNGRYQEFLSNLKVRGTGGQIIFSYLSILQDDPQLPFEILPGWWLGDEAYEEFTRAISGKSTGKRTEYS